MDWAISVSSSKVSSQNLRMFLSYTEPSTVLQQDDQRSLSSNGIKQATVETYLRVSTNGL